MAASLRIYYGPENDLLAGLEQNQSRSSEVRVSLREIFPLLADAVQSQRTWLRDFAEDEVAISADLYEVILAYQHHRRPSA